MENLRVIKFEVAYELLKEAEGLLLSAKVPNDIDGKDKMKLLALTYNNLGCFHKKLVL